VPESVHRLLKARAAMDGVSMSAYFRRLIERDLQRPGRQEVLDRLRALAEIETDISAPDGLREARGAAFCDGRFRCRQRLAAAPQNAVPGPGCRPPILLNKLRVGFPDSWGDSRMKDSQRKGKEFEDLCQRLIGFCFPAREWWVDREWRAAHGRIDFFVRRKGGGGRRLVFECKHMPEVGLRRRDVDQARRYKRSGAADAIILVSADTPVSRVVASYAEHRKVVLLSVKMGRRLPSLIRNVARVLWQVR